jgi:hypothetical protein
MMNMFVNYVYTKYITAHIHQGLNPRTCGNTPRFEPPNHFKTLLTKKKKFEFIVFGMKLFKKSKL